MILLLLVLVPVVIGVAAFVLGKRRITPLELAVQLGVLLAVAYGGWLVARYGAIRDTEIWSGRVADKITGSESCCHSYDCNCHESCSGTGSERSCHEQCSTCYEHSDDVYWAATSTNAEVIFSDGCNPPGSAEPAAWTRIVIGEPTAWEHSFTNYVLADPAAVLGDLTSFQELQERVPPYPRVSGHSARRFVFVGLPDLELHGAIAELNADLGVAKQVNLIVVVAAEADPRYFDALRAAWLGGKKNDVVLVIGAPAFPAIAWARVMAWNASSGAEDDFVGVLSSRIAGLGAFDGKQVLGVLREEVSGRYTRRPFAELAYLWERARPSTLSVVLLLVAELLLSALFTFVFWRNGRRMAAPVAGAGPAGQPASPGTTAPAPGAGR